MPRRGPDHDPNDPAPALTRGLRIIRSLAQDGPSLLEHLARREHWPKSSTYRLLAALERAGAAARDPLTRRWHARMQLHEATGVDTPERARMRSLLVDLAQAAGHTAEAYGFRPEHMILIERAEPEDGEAAVRARIGFIREWTEMDAVTQVAMAFGFSEPPLAAHHCCVDRTRQPIGHDEIRALLADVRSHGCAADRGINDNGVRRFAAPVIQAGKLIGAIAIAQGGGVPMGRDDARLLELVRATVLRI